MTTGWVFLDGTPVPSSEKVEYQDGSRQPMVFRDGRWDHVKWIETTRAEAMTSSRSVSEPTEPEELLAGLRNGKWLDEQVFDPLEYAVPGILPEGLSLLAGAPKIGKSWLALSWSLAVASGGHALGRIFVGEPRPTLYLALEDGDRRLQDRCRRLLEGAPIPELFNYITRVEPGLVIDTLQAWLELHGDARPLVTLDTLGKVMPPALAGETTYGRDYRIGSTLHALCDERPGSSLLIPHHDRKAGASDFVATVSGTNGLAGAADTVIVLARERHEATGVLKVTGRDVAEDEYALTFTDGGVWALDGADLEAAAAKAQQDRVTSGLGDRSAEVAAFVLARPQGVRAADVTKVLEISDHTARTYLARLAEAGRIARASRGLYTPPVATVATVALDDETSISPVAADVERNTRITRNTPTEAATHTDFDSKLSLDEEGEST